MKVHQMWQEDLRPFQVYGKLWHVGGKSSPSYLFDTGDGLLLLDTGVVIGTSTYLTCLNGTYGFLTLLPDLIGSIGVLVLFTILLRRAHRNLQGAT
jgi:hypothetical protein